MVAIDYKTDQIQVRVRSWKPRDRAVAAAVIGAALSEYGLDWEPEGADRDVVEVEHHYHERGGEFWVVERWEADQQNSSVQNSSAQNPGDRRILTVVGTAAYYPIDRPESLPGSAVEIRKMYFSPVIRGQGLGRFILHQLEETIRSRGFTEIWIETASVLKEAVQLYESSGYQSATGVETLRCDRVYRKILTPQDAVQ